MNVTSRKVEQRTESVLKFIAEFVDENGFAPSYREICAGTELRSTSTAKAYILKLEQLGYIVFKNGPRKIVVTDDGWKKVGMRT